MEEITKGMSPFYPGQPVPVELFVGRAQQIERIVTRGVGQVALGKPVSIYVQGEYGIGKSSFARFIQWIAEKEYALHGIYVNVGGAQTLDDLAASILEATIRSGALDPKKSEKFKSWLAKYIGEVTLFGFKINTKALKDDAPNFSSPFGMLSFLSELQERLTDIGIKGIFLILDEINGITSNPLFANFIKGLVDTNALSHKPIPLLLMLCGVEERRREMIQKHQPIERIFDVVDIMPLNEQEMEEFFKRAFDSVQMTVEPEGMWFLTHYSAGFPKIMHLIGDTAYWIDKDNIIDEVDASLAVFTSADDVGKKYVDQQIYGALQSADYRSILDKIGMMSPNNMKFTKEEVSSDLTESEKKKFNNFLRKMVTLKVFRKGDIRSEYIFNNRMVRLYIWLKTSPPKPSAKIVNTNRP
jgi:hypothetical protein